VAVVIIAAALRLFRVRLGLPDLIEEAIPLRLALAMRDPQTGHIDWNPHQFNYPSLSIYLHFLVQQAVYAVGHAWGAYGNYADYVIAYTIDPSPMVISARLVGIAGDVFTVVAVMRIASALAPGAAPLAGLLTAASPLLIVTSSSVFCDTIMVTLSLWAIERMLAWHTHGGRRWAGAAVLIGMAAGAKYPAAVLLLPLVWLLWTRDRARGLRDAARCCGIAAATFVLTTPYSVLDFGTFWREFAIEAAHPSAGHLGSLDRHAALFHARGLVDNLGWLGMGLLVGSIPLLILSERRNATVQVLALSFVCFALPIGFARIEAGRYLAPLVPLASILAAGTLLRLGASVRRVGAVGSVLASLILLAPVARSALRAAREGPDTTQAAARRWCERHLGDRELLLQEAYSAPLPTRDKLLRLEHDTAYRNATPRMQRRLLAVRTFRVVALPLGVSGPCVNPVRAASGREVTLPVFPHRADVNQIFYDPRVFAAADLVMTSSAVRGRFEADTVRFQRQRAVYAWLERHADHVATFSPGERRTGPGIELYRITARAREAAQALGTIDPLWWAESVPRAYRDQASRLLSRAGGVTERDVRTRDGAAAPWVSSLSDFYSARIAGFAGDMAIALGELQRFEGARFFATATLELFPADGDATIVYSVASRHLGQWRKARERLEQNLEAAGTRGSDPAVRLEYARALAHTGDPSRARRELQALAARQGPDDPMGREALAALKELQHPGAP